VRTDARITTAAELAEQQQQDEASPPAVPEGFCVRDEKTANWVVRKVVEARQYARHVQEWAAREVRRAQSEEKFLVHRFGHQLEDWVRRKLESENGRRRKSVNLPAGTVGFRTEPPRLDVTDEEALLRWCRQHLPAAVATAEHVLKQVVREHIAATGEVPAGAEPSEGGEKFFIK
jgi:phage host-nuclease inhibitor protein Gam